MINVSAKDLNVHDLVRLLFVAGYEHQVGDFEFTDEHNFFRYEKYDHEHNQHCYMVGFYDDNDENFYVTRAYIFLNQDGYVAADWQGMPQEHFDTIEELQAYFDKLPVR